MSLKLLGNIDDPVPFTRVKRYAQVTSAASGLAARYVASRFLGVQPDHHFHAEHLFSLLGNLKGPVMKIAQFLATIPEALPPEYAAEFLQLQSQAPPMGPGFVRRRMSAELGTNWRSHFQTFDETAAAAASLGQVHKATTLDGALVACKLQYPDMNTFIETDLNQLRWILNAYEMMSRALQTDALQEEIKNLLAEELDYRHEASNIALYRQIFNDDSHIQIPSVVEELSTSRLLTMEWLEGQSVLEQAENLSAEDCNHLGILLFQAWYRPFYHFGVIHGDPHPGNYTLASSGQLNLLDFGCVRLFPSNFVGGVIDLYRALQTEDRDRAVQAYQTWGFTHLTHETIDIITQWARLLYEPLLDDRIRPIQDFTQGQKGWAVASQVHEALHKIGGIRPPREFVFMDRAAVGIGSVIMRIKAQANWHRLFEELIDQSEPKKFILATKEISLKSKSNICVMEERVVP